MTTRRHFLKQLSAAGLGVGALGAYTDLQRIAAAASLSGPVLKAPGEDYRALICLFMFGGNDGNNTVIPTSATEYPQYASGRTPALALAQGSLLPLTTSNTPGRTFGLHPAMTGLQGLYNAGRAAIVANAGPLLAPLTRAQLQARSVPVPPDLYSHSDQQAQWQSSISDGAPRSGWGGRVADLMKAANTTNTSSTLISVAGNNLFGVGTTLSSFKVSPGNQFGFDFYKGSASTDPLSKAITEQLALPSANLFDGAWKDVISRAIQNQQILASALAAVPPFTTVFPNTGIGSQMQMIARLLSARASLGLKRQVFFCSLGGFDTHGDEQLGRQAELLGEVSAALTALYNATVELNCADLVTSFTSSDFCRTFPSNGKGSDHAWGNHHFVVGGAVQGGKMYGTFPTLVRGGPDDTGNGGLWIPTTSVDQYAATLASWFGVGTGELATIFPNLSRFGAANLGFLG
ncbi:DUF1501 domain-containing protein [Usitatibacter palustris]|uniref:Tat (Twin-arginine translocation) pathway signal sequence n=1 Tax=Usitatibacter palustris TaxID=2732487 RepID=A0A6M4H8Q3_9PROT|nr:DUF1501 domain-containing protein [Usitatibacter palustris]QJR15188.1 hypothetical protein DSM104440_02005 [Usitatibacter palustris]